MQDKRLVLCGGADYEIPAGLAERAMQFHLHGGDDEFKVTLGIEDIHRSMYKDVPVRFHDLLEIATYVYCADQEWARGQKDAETFGANWRRHFHFVIPVRDTGFWNSAEVTNCLTDTLGFLSDDHYEFEFVGAPNRPPLDRFLKFNERGELLGFPDQVMLFSGGLDSLGGAVDEIVNQKRRIVLVNHKASPKLNGLYRRLAAKLAAKAPECPAPYHVRVTVHKREWMNKEYTQRSRSFLYVSIGATIARMLGHDNVRFYENGVVSMNLPIAAQVVGGKATRTTHPRVIAGYQQLLSLVAQAPFRVETPFIWKTKSEVVELIARAHCQHMLVDSISCAHTWEMQSDKPHCGTCSQCLDRRFAVIAAKMEQYDPVENYVTDVFTDVRRREKGDEIAEDKLLYAGYLERANQVQSIHDPLGFLTTFPEAARAIKYLPGNADAVAAKLLDLYKRHSAEVNGVIDKMFSLHGAAIRQRTLPPNALLRVVCESRLPVSVPAAGGAAMPASVFRRIGDHWQVRFKGRNAFYLVSVNTGAKYLCHVLAQPHTPTPVVELVLGTAIDPLDTAMSDSGEVATRQAIREYRQRALDLLDEVTAAKEVGDTERVEKLYEEMAGVERAMSEAQGLRGRSRKAQSGKERIRKAFQAAVRRAMEKIAETDKPLAEHLRACVECGTDPCYHPNEDIKWETTPVLAD